MSDPTQAAEQAIRVAKAALIGVDPTKTTAVDHWFEVNAAFIVPVANALARQFARIGDDIQNRSAVAIVGDLLAALEARQHPMAERARKLSELLRVVTESMIRSFRQSPNTGAWTLPSTPSERLAVNAEAIRIAALGKPPTDAQRKILWQYTGNGGLSLEKLAELVPADWVPTSKALVDEYYTPPEVCAAIAEIVSRLVGEIGLGDLSGPAIEPSCGVGRFIGAFLDRPEFSNLQWNGIEFSQISATIASLLYSHKATVYHAPFESWIADNFNKVSGGVALVVTNPPYGKRGGNKTLDPDKSYREEVAYVYMIRRAFDLLRAGGIGVALVPQGFLSGSGPAHKRVRELVLRRHHLLLAYRLPSSLYLGADIVTDVSFWQARGGELPSVLPDDQAIADGNYFSVFPNNVLGQEQTSARGRYQVKGDFSGLPEREARRFCSTCAVVPFQTRLERKLRPEESLSPELFGLHLLGQRVEGYLALLSAGRQKDLQAAADRFGELKEALQAWLATATAKFGIYKPREDKELVSSAQKLPSLASLLAVVDDSGGLIPALRDPPSYTTEYNGAHTIGGHAEWLHAKRRRLTIADLAEFRESLGYKDEPETLQAELLSAGWCIDDGLWVPGSEYYSGDLWPKIDRAKADGGILAQAQLARLMQRVGPVTLEDAEPQARSKWIPPDMLREFLSDWLNKDVPKLHWYRGLLKPTGISYKEVSSLAPELQVAIGYLNHDLALFGPPYEKQEDPATGQEESAEAALDRVRMDFHKRISDDFTKWLAGKPEHQESVLSTYQRLFRGYVLPEFPPDPLPIQRWGNRITPKPHQRSGAWRLIKSNGGLLAYDVGVGNTLTRIAAIAYLRQIGRARRPLIIVPNSIIWKWHREITRALPDYSVAVIGSVRYLGRGGVYRSRLDESAERLTKWASFQAGLYDVALVTYSVFSYTSISKESLKLFVEETPAQLRALGLKSAKLEEELEDLEKLYKKRKQLLVDIAEMERDGEADGDTQDD